VRRRKVQARAKAASGAERRTEMVEQASRSQEGSTSSTAEVRPTNARTRRRRAPGRRFAAAEIRGGYPRPSADAPAAYGGVKARFAQTRHRRAREGQCAAFRCCGSPRTWCVVGGRRSGGKGVVGATKGPQKEALRKQHYSPCEDKSMSRPGNVQPGGKGSGASSRVRAGCCSEIAAPGAQVLVEKAMPAITKR